MEPESKITDQQISALLQVTEDNLYFGLGQKIVSEEVVLDDDVIFEGVYGLHQSLEFFQKIQGIGKDYLNEKSELLHETICIKWEFCTKQNNNSFADNVQLVAWLVDALTVVLTQSPLTVATVAVILVKRGLSRFCNCDYQQV